MRGMRSQFAHQVVKPRNRAREPDMSIAMEVGVIDISDDGVGGSLQGRLVR